MTKRDFLAVAFRIFGITLFVKAIVSGAQIIGYMPRTEWAGDSTRVVMLWSTVSLIAIMTIAGVILMACANGIAASMVPEDQRLDWPEWLCDKGVLFDFASRIYGVVLLAHSIPSLVAAIVAHWQSSDVNIQSSYLATQSIVPSAISFVIGVLLVVGIGRIGSFVRNVVRAGRKTLEGPDAR